MREWWQVKKSKTKRHQKKKEGRYTYWDGIMDALWWIPDLLLLPFRLLFWLLRAVWRLFDFT